MAHPFRIQGSEFEARIHVEAAALPQRIVEPGEQRAQLAAAAVEQAVGMTALRHALAMGRAFGQFVALDQGNALEVIGQHARRAHPADTSADHNDMVCFHVYGFTS